MLNLNSPVVQNMIQSNQGFNPYKENMYAQQQPTYQDYEYGYNPYIANKMAMQEFKEEEIIADYYDRMPQVIVNQARGIQAGNFQQQPQQNMYYNNYGYGYNNGYYNNNAFNGYINPIFQRNKMEADRIKQREEAIAQGKIWKSLFKNAINEEEDGYSIDDVVNVVEHMFYSEPINTDKDIPIKKRIIREKNMKIAELDARMDYYRANNIHIPDQNEGLRNRIYNHYNELNSIYGDNCDLADYFGRAYGEIKVKQMEWEAERQRKDLKNKFKNKDFNTLLDKEAKSDSYYYKLMEDFAENGVTLTNGDGLTMTADEMEIKLPERLIKNRQDKYYENRKKFYESVFKKE